MLYTIISVGWLTWHPSNLSTNCFCSVWKNQSIPQRTWHSACLQRHPERQRWPFLQREAGRRRRALCDYCVGTLTTCWSALPSSKRSSTSRLTTFNLSAPPVQLSYALRKGKKRGKKKKEERTVTQVTLHVLWSPDPANLREALHSHGWSQLTPTWACTHSVMLTNSTGLIEDTTSADSRM